MEKTGEHHKKRKHTLKPYKRALLFGTFNPLHCGHIRLFRRATDLADEVYVVCDDDKLIRDKGREPFGSKKQRREDIEMIKGVVFSGFEGSKKYWVSKIKPDILIKGDDWAGKGWSGEGLGVEVLYLAHTKNIHSHGLGVSKN
jgi:glycerol-3-phosphate cytidylyltransferase